MPQQDDNNYSTVYEVFDGVTTASNVITTDRIPVSDINFVDLESNVELCAYCGMYRDIVKKVKYECSSSYFDVAETEAKYCKHCANSVDFELTPCSQCTEPVYKWLYRSCFALRSHDGNTYETYCPKCIKKNKNKIRSCYSCGEYTFHYDDLVINGRSYCGRCSWAVFVQEYNYKPEPIYFGNGRVFGVELEISCNKNKCAAELSKLVRHRAYLKSDSSIQPEGIEVVTHPMSLKEHRNYWANFCNKIDREQFYIFGNTNGFHVHMGRDQLTKLLIGKMLKFVDTNRSLIKMVSGRATTYATFGKLSKITHVEKGGVRDKYSALNLLPPYTVEMRTFQGSLDYSVIMSYIEFCDAMIQFCDKSSIESISSPAYNKFLDYIRANKKQWPELYYQLRKLGYLGKTKSEINKENYEKRVSTACA